MKRSPGFSLLELMVSTAVLSVVMILLLQATGAVSKTWSIGAARIDNLAQARGVIALIDRDLQSAIVRPDLATFLDENGKTACAFYSMVRGGNGARRLSAISYSIPAGNLALQRKDYGLDYTGRVLSLNQLDKLPQLGDAEALTERISAGAVCFSCQFLNGEGKLQDSFHFDYKNPDSLSNTRTVVLSLLVLDNAAYDILNTAGTVPDFAAQFSGKPAPEQTYADFWSARIATLPPNLPEPVRGGIRIFERALPIPCP